MFYFLVVHLTQKNRFQVLTYEVSHMNVAFIESGVFYFPF